MDAENNFILQDEIGKMPLVFKMDGSKFRYDLLKIAFQVGQPRSIEQLKTQAQELIDFVNNDPTLKFSQPVNSKDK